MEFGIYPSLRGRTVYITGGASGIGAELVREFAAQGCRVGFVDLDAGAGAALARETPGEVAFEPCDLRDIPALQAAFARLRDRVGPAQVLVNNAARDDRHDWRDVTVDYWDERAATNIRHMFFAIQAVAPDMIAAGGGAIVNTASQWGLYPAPNHIAYNVTKAAVASFTQNLARDYAPQKIRVNAVCPGEIHTPMLEAGVKRSGRTIADLDKLVPFGRIGKPEEVAALVAFLASDEAAFMCGSLVEITGAQAVA